MTVRAAGLTAHYKLRPVPSNFEIQWCPSSPSTVCPSGSTNLLTNGDFEDGWTQPWRSVAAGQNFNGWTVTQGNIDYGNYNTGGHCTTPCAASGQAFLDLCGNTRGGIAQIFPTTAQQSYVVTPKLRVIVLKAHR